MKFSAKKEALADKLSLCSSIAEKRQTIPILSNVLLKANNGNLTIVATDLERQLSLIVSDCSISDDGETTVSARKLFELIRSVPDDTELNFEVSENQLEISALSFQADLAVLPVQDFPFVDLEDHNFNITLDGSKFGKVLECSKKRKNLITNLNGALEGIIKEVKYLIIGEVPLSKRMSIKLMVIY